MSVSRVGPTSGPSHSACWLLSLHYGQAVCFCCLDRVERKPIFSCRTGWTLRAVKVVLSSLRGNEDFWGKVFLCSDGKPGSLIWSLTNYERSHFGRVQFYRRALQFSFSVTNIINMSEMIYLFSSFLRRQREWKETCVLDWSEHRGNHTRLDRRQCERKAALWTHARKCVFL